jgi:hypothetical protein
VGQRGQRRARAGGGLAFHLDGVDPAFVDLHAEDAVADRLSRHPGGGEAVAGAAEDAGDFGRQAAKLRGSKRPAAIGLDRGIERRRRKHRRAVHLDRAGEDGVGRGGALRVGDSNRPGDGGGLRALLHLLLPGQGRIGAVGGLGRRRRGHGEQGGRQQRPPDEVMTQRCPAHHRPRRSA